MNEASRLPRVQFDLRTIFFWTFVVSMVLATVSPLFRSWSSGKRWFFVGMLALQVSIFWGIVYFGWRARLRAMAKAGTCEFNSSFFHRRFDTRTEQLKAVLPMLGAIGYQVILFTVFTEASPHNRFAFYCFGPQLQWTAFLATSCVGHWFRTDSRDLEICEHGYIYGAVRFVPWNLLVDVRPGTYGGGSIVFVLLDANGLQGTHTFSTDPNLRDEFVERLSAKIK